MGMIQIRNVPGALHKELKVRAARKGMTLSDYLLEMVRRELERPDQEELLRRIREMPRVYLSESAADAVRAERESRY